MRSRFCFDDVVLDLEAFRLTRGGREVHLEPKVLELLGYLVQHRGRLVEKAELQGAVWSDAAVSESALTRAVAQLRKALDDDAREARYVETVPTRGYRFRPDVRVQEARGARSDVSPDGATPSDSRSARRQALLARLAAAALGLALALGGVYAFRADRSRAAVRPSVREHHRTLVSTSRGFNGYPAFSPDGGTLAFSSDRSGRLELYVRPLAPGARETPVTSDGHDNVQPAWSPDGRYIAYHSMRRGGLWLVPALGGTPRQLTTFGSAPAWSPDGRRVAFSSLGLASLDGMTQPTATLFVLDVAAPAAEPRPLTAAGEPPFGHGPPAFSPDGSQVYFAADGVWAVDSSGASAPHQVVRGSAVEVAPSPDGRFLLWTGWERGNWHVWSALLGRPGEAAGEASELVNTGDVAARHLALSKDGRLACSLTAVVSELALVSLSRDGGPAAAPVEPWPGNTGRKVQLHFAPDGRTLAFARVQPGQALEVFGLDVETNSARPLLSDAQLGQLGGWFPQGDALLVTSRGQTEKSLLRAQLSGGRHERLASADGMGWARLLPPGREVVFQSTAGGGILNIHRARLDGGGARALTDDPEGVGWPVPSPDGRTLAVEMFRGNDTQLGLLPADGGVARALTRLPGQHWVHDWSRDGRRALYAARRDGLWNVYWMDVETGEERRLTDHGRVRDAVRTPAWSPAGDRVAYERIETTGAVWLIELRGPSAAGTLALARQD